MKMNVKIKKENEIGEFRSREKAKRLKNSRKRTAVVDYFLKEDRHFTIEELYHEIKKINSGISYATVYRALRLLADMGLANVCRFKGRETRFEPRHRSEHHDHLICVRCGRIIEFSQNEIEKLQERVAAQHKFKVASHILELYGFCEKCAKTGKGTRA